jgi:hypothetical protein
MNYLPVMYEAAMVSWGFWLLHGENIAGLLYDGLGDLNRRNGRSSCHWLIYSPAGRLRYSAKKSFFRWKPFCP